ncbi:acyl-CoA dehydrogenase [Pseudobdellovibrio exovorus]|uniref:Short/branched chain specific acyl-CoA dehydrogenase, mitochondrial n=1 Tax=Pseudobdellovibrio exovorus JSS TaxID=1184267 RepID=M4VC10_9BACT|nr:acyl-CoA dehydrogenase [Pseudobdellovibrio exovorus]AGH95556.1 butyryl-CoA dehydrogenase [Pseudobdellovibrio exovorus JSS]
MSTHAQHPALTMWSEDEIAFRDAVRSFAEAEVKPHVVHMDEQAEMKSDIVSKLFEMGLMGIESPEQFGGAGTSFTMACIAIEELGRVDGSVSVLCDVQNTLVTNAIIKYGSPSLKEKYLPKLAREWVGAYCLSESSSGSDAFALKCRAEKKDGKWVLNGNKLWITNGKEASFFIVFANIDPSKGYKGITAFIVEKGFKGFTVGKKEDKLGIRASSTCELIFENCEVPEENILGEIGKGYKIAIETLNEGRIGIGAQMIGIAQGAYDATLSYIKSREQFGKAIGQFQGVQFQLAQMRIELEAARLMVYNAARLKDAGQDFIESAAMAKYYSSKVAEKITSTAIDLFGGNGFTKEYPVEKFWRDAKIGQIYEGTSNMQLQTIAKIEMDKA